MIIDCRSGNFKCPLGQLGCNSPQISGQPASCVENTHNTGQKCLCQKPLVGPNQYDLMVIGDSPSIEDDQLNMVWSDNSGIQIINYLKKAGHDLTRVWMTKLTKCKPKVQGRKPSVSEMNICRDNYLKKEIELIKPKVVILVGATALKAFNLTGRGSINAIHGKVFEARFAKSKEMTNADYEAQPVYKVIPTINPTTFFYNPNKKLQARIGHDYVVAKDLLDGKEPTSHFVPDYHLIDSAEKLEWLEEKLLNSTIFGWDTEFPKLGFRKVPVICFQFAWGWESDQCAVLPIMQHDPNAPKEQEFHLKPFFGMKNDDLVTKFMKKVFLTPNIIKAGHNQKGDAHILRWNYGIVPQGFLFDTLISKHLMDENPPSDLEFLCDLEFSWGDYGGPRRAITGSGKKLKATFDKVPDKILWPYAATDALGSYRLGILHLQKLKDKPNLWKFFLEESEKLQRPLAKAEYRGALIHQEVMNILEDQFEKEQKKLLTKLRKITSKPDFNPMSPKQVLPAFLLMGVTNVDLKDNKNSSGVSTGKTKLLNIAAKGIEPAASFASALSTYRNRNKMINTYLKNCKNDLDSDGRIRYPWKMTGAKTGRLSCEFFHQISKINEAIICYGPNGSYVPFNKRLKDKRVVMRDLIVAAPGYKIVYGDFSQIELRIVAIISNDKEMLLIFSDPNGDLHTITAYEFVRTQWPGMREQDVNKFNREHVGKCYSADTELLTLRGWVRLDNLPENSIVAQWEKTNNQISFKRISGKYKFYETPKRYKDRHTDLVVTDNHIQPLYGTNNRLYEYPISKYKNWQLNRWSAPHAGELNTEGGLSELMTRLLVMVQADGSYDKGKIRFGFSKETKVNRCVNLLTEANSIFTRYRDKNNVTRIDLSAMCPINKELIRLMPNKQFNWNLAWKFNRKAFLDEVSRWDSHIHKKGYGSGFSRGLISYTNTCKVSAEVVQALAVLSGRKSTLRKCIPKNKNHRLTWSVSFRNHYSPKGECSWHRNGIEVLEKQEVYCVSVPSGFLLTRRNGKVTISHNSINFGFVYGSEGYQLVRMGKWMDQNGVERNFTWDFLNRGMAAWKERFKGVGKFIDLTPDLIRARGNTAVSVFGRERHFGHELNSSNDYERAHAERQCINDLIQSPAASILNRTIIAVDDMLESFNIPEEIVCPINCVHDSAMYEVRDSHVDWFENAFQIISQKKYPELGNASFKMNIGTGQTWASAEINAK